MAKSTPEPLFTAARESPANLQAEQALLGALLANSRAFDRCATIVRPEMFADPVHGRIFTEIARVVLAGGVADAVTLRSRMSEQDLDEVGGVAYLGQLIGAMVGIPVVSEYAKVIADTWARRSLIEAASVAVDAAYNLTTSFAEAVATLSASVDAIGGIKAVREAVDLSDAMEEVMRLSDLAAKGRLGRGLPTGMMTVDHVTGGMEPGALWILAGRPGMGKSALGAAWAVATASALYDEEQSGGEPRGVLAISLEMSAVSVARRLLAAASSVPNNAIKRGELSMNDAERLIEGQRALFGLPIRILDEGGLGMAALRIRVRQEARKRKLAMIMVDHLHLIAPDEGGPRQGGTYEVGKIATGLLALAKEMNCPVLALAQLSRGVEGRDDKRPILSDLRQAGEIEQNADVVAFVYRAEYYLSKTPPDQGTMSDEAWMAARNKWFKAKDAAKGKAELIMAKVRDGEQAVVHLRFDAPTTHFTESPIQHMEE